MKSAIAVYDCTADDDGELSFKKGDTLVDVVESNEEGWFFGRLEGTSSRGLFPYNYVQLLEEPLITPSQNHASSKAIPPKHHHNTEINNQFGTSVSPPNSTLSSTWSIISTKDDDDSQIRSSSDRKMSTAADAFEKAIAPKPHSVKASNNSNNKSSAISASAIAVPVPESGAKEKPSVAPKPALLKMVAAPSTMTTPRVRSYSTSATAHMRDSDGPTKLLGAFKNQSAGNSTPAVRHKPMNTNSSTLASEAAISYVERGLSMSSKGQNQPERVIFDNDVVEDDDGYQVLVTPSLLRQRQPSALVSQKTSSSRNLVKTSSQLNNLPAAHNPAPRLPSRPSALPGRRPRSTKSSSGVTSSLALPPNPKPKPTQLECVPLSPRGNKGRSVSNPPPIQPKPLALTPSRPDLPGNSKRDAVRKPPPPPAQQSSPHTPALPARPVAARRDQFEQKQQEVPARNDVLNRARSKSNGWKPSTPPVLPARTVSTRQIGEPVKKTPPPPPPSRPVQISTSRYEDLFNAIHDDGVVDGHTARIIWRRSRVPDDMLARIWQQCDPQGVGLLNKQAFIQGMREIDAILAQKSIAV
ncbi:hypothetical protein BX666DRAFT_632016 [Dichotomocladium elegans]|nr:hypothetical protein BX666DRAFT_632016 [Dichotomocladium elegans]